MTLHNTGWTRLEKTAINQEGEVSGGAVREEGIMEEIGLGHGE